jgi:hypothetical protein
MLDLRRHFFPITNKKQQTKNNKQKTTNKKQQTKNNKQKTTNKKQQTPNNKQQTLHFHENRHPYPHHARQNAELGE